MIGYTIAELHDKLKKGTITSELLVHESLLDARDAQKKINAFVTICDASLEEAKQLNQTKEHHYLYGIPNALKDLICTKGTLTTASSKMLANFIPTFDATVVEKLKEAGSICVGKTSLDEFGMGGTNKTAITGPTYNPWDLTRITGGSSGGSAAVVASGILPFSIGTDTGDSIRKPAAYCGIVGMKPTYGLVSRYGVIPYASSLDHVGAFTRSVEDMAMVLSEISGYDEKDFTSLEMKQKDYYANLNDDLKGKKIAVIKTIVDAVADKKILESFNAAIAYLEASGATVEYVDMDAKLLRTLLPVYTIIANAEATANHACYDGVKYGLRVEGDTLTEMMTNTRTQGFGINCRMRYVAGCYALATENQEFVFKKAKRVRRLITNQLQTIMNQYDAILTPAAPSIAPKVEDHRVIDELSDDHLIAENHLLLGNFSGMPSITIPSGFLNEMPVAINIMANHFEDQEVLNIAAALEKKFGLKNQFARVI